MFLSTQESQIPDTWNPKEKSPRFLSCMKLRGLVALKPMVCKFSKTCGDPNCTYGSTLLHSPHFPKQYGSTICFLLDMRECKRVVRSFIVPEQIGGPSGSSTTANAIFSPQKSHCTPMVLQLWSVSVVIFPSLWLILSTLQCQNCSFHHRHTYSCAMQSTVFRFRSLQVESRKCFPTIDFHWQNTTSWIIGKSSKSFLKKGWCCRNCRRLAQEIGNGISSWPLSVSQELEG